ncbi:MAG: pilus (MSHA type) biogenesis protein MshL [Gallionella sp.]|nr:pilus (MSHA type) biogenesis protein MshL [Gallionella sp.]
MRAPQTLSLCAVGLLLTSCGTKPIQPSDHHMMREAAPTVASKEIPQPITSGVVLPPPKPISKTATYSVVVTNVPAQQILFELARDAKINLDIHGGIDGLVTINAINQTLEQILSRIARQVDMRYELSNGSLIVMPDTPYLHSYKIDYVNMARDSESSISNSTQISGGGTGSGAAGGSASNKSSIEIKDTSKNRFWETLTQNIKDILHETDKILPAGSSETTTQQSKSSSSTGTGVTASDGNKKSSAKIGVENSPNPVSVEEGDVTVTRRSTFREAASVIANPENGLITVRATGKQHEKIREFVDQIMSSARRQVLIEATVVEVKLNDQYQQGINWSALTLGAKGFKLTQAGTGIQPAARTGSMFLLDYTNPTSKLGNLAASVSLLESFGNVKVLSSPKLSVLNNQTAMLRVVDNVAYFTTDVQIVLPTATTPGSNTYTTTLHSTPVGLTMSVTPQISDSDVVSLVLKPSITRVIGTINDPNPALAAAGVISVIPQTQTREMESVLRINNNQIAVMGGLMQDSIDKKTDSVPFLGSIPLIGNLFQNRNDVTTKSELVIFLHPVVIKDSSLTGDYSNFRGNLPDQEFFHESASGKQ